MLTTQLHLVPRLRKSAAIPQLHCIISSCSAYVNIRKIYFHFYKHSPAPVLTACTKQIPLQKLTVTQPVQKFPTFHRTQVSLPFAYETTTEPSLITEIPATCSRSTSYTSIIIFSSHWNINIKHIICFMYLSPQNLSVFKIIKC